MAKIYIETPITEQETIEVINQMRDFCQNYLNESFRWIAGVKIAGQRARGNMYNIVNNASVANKAMIELDKRR